METKKDLISVIIPVYNVEKYLERCLESVVAQSYHSIEVILVNDGSTDESPRICDEWSKKDSRIKAFHKENGGASSARNTAISNLSEESKYIIFIDSDDYIYPNTIELLYEAVTLDNYDFVSNYSCEQTIELKKDYELFLKYITSVYSYGPVEKIYRTDLIKDNDLKFNVELKTAEDTLFIRQYLKYCQKIQLINEKLYFYFQENANSLTKKGYRDYCLYYKYKLDALDELLVQIELPQNRKRQFLSERAVHGLKVSLEHYHRFFSSHELKMLGVRTINTILPYVIDNENIPSELKKWYTAVIDQEHNNVRWFRFKCIDIPKKIKIKLYKFYRRFHKK